MQRTSLLATLIVSFVLGAGVLFTLNGSGLFTTSRSTKARAASLSANSTSGSIAARVSSTATPMLVPVQPDMKTQAELQSVLLLYDSTQMGNFDVNFCKTAEQYGLFCGKTDISRMKMTDDLLRDQHGRYFRLVGISADTLLRNPPLLNEEGIAILKSAVAEGGINLFVGKVTNHPDTDRLIDPNVLTRLTDGAITGVTKPLNAPHKEWFVSTAAPEITGAFTGQVISSTASLKNEFSLTPGKQQLVTILITSINEAETYPIFLKCRNGNGSIFIDAGENAESLETTQLVDMFDPEHFSKTAPLMMAVRYALGD